MPHFRELNKLLEEVTLWADLRHEQGVDATRVAKILHGQLRRALAYLKRVKPSNESMAKEPNSLEAIQSLRRKGRVGFGRHL